MPHALRDLFLAIGIVAFAAPRAIGATPSSGTLSPLTPSLTFAGGPFTGANPTNKLMCQLWVAARRRSKRYVKYPAATTSYDKQNCGHHTGTPGLAISRTPGRSIAAIEVKRSRSSRRAKGRLPSTKVGSEKNAFSARGAVTVTPPIAMSKRPARK